MREGREGGGKSVCILKVDWIVREVAVCTHNGREDEHARTHRCSNVQLREDVHTA